MGQYFRAVNDTKKEVVCPWCVGGFAKLWEWAANPWGALFVLLLRKSDSSGGGDYYGYSTRILQVDHETPESMAHAISKVAAMEGAPAPHDPESLVGRWAGDEVYLVGDYDSSGLYQDSFDYRNISQEMIEVWNSFIDMDDLRLKYTPDCECKKIIAELDAM